MLQPWAETFCGAVARAIRIGVVFTLGRINLIYFSIYNRPEAKPSYTYKPPPTPLGRVGARPSRGGLARTPRAEGGAGTSRAGPWRWGVRSRGNAILSSARRLRRVPSCILAKTDCGVARYSGRRSHIGLCQICACEASAFHGAILPGAGPFGRHEPGAARVLRVPGRGVGGVRSCGSATLNGGGGGEGCGRKTAERKIFKKSKIAT